MVTVHRFESLRFVIYSNDHDPAHVHVLRAGCEAKVQLVGPTPSILWQHGFSPAELRRIFEETQKERFRLLKRWKEIHG
jgi:hypothetical protein